MVATASPARANPTATDRILAEIKKIDERLSPIEGLMKTLKEPASKVGLSPEEFLAKATSGNSLAYGIDSQGRVMPAAVDLRKRGLGAGDLWRAMCKHALPAAHTSGIPEEEARGAFAKYEKLGFRPYQEKAALAESSGLTGGYTVPPVFAAQLLTMAIEDTIIPPRATHMPMSSLTLQIPSLDLTTAQGAGNSPFLGGVQVQWTSEAATRAEYEPQVRQTELKAHEASFYSVMSNTLLADNGVGLDSVLTQLFPAAIGWYTDYAFFQGTGTGQPLGILNAPATIKVTRAGGANGSTFAFADVVTMWSKLYGVVSWRNPKTVWVMNPSVFPKLMQINDGASRVIFIPLNAGLQEALPQSSGAYSAGYLLGAPVIFTEKLPALSNDGDVMLIDCSKYLIGDRSDLQIDVSPHVNFLKNQMVWRVVWRGDGQPWLNGSITLADNTSKVSPFVILH